jgi:hypothetical protein
VTAPAPRHPTPDTRHLTPNSDTEQRYPDSVLPRALFSAAARSAHQRTAVLRGTSAIRVPRGRGATHPAGHDGSRRGVFVRGGPHPPAPTRDHPVFPSPPTGKPGPRKRGRRGGGGAGGGETGRRVTDPVPFKFPTWTPWTTNAGLRRDADQAGFASGERHGHHPPSTPCPLPPPRRSPTGKDRPGKADRRPCMRGGGGMSRSPQLCSRRNWVGECSRCVNVRRLSHGAGMLEPVRTRTTGWRGRCWTHWSSAIGGLSRMLWWP